MALLLTPACGLLAIWMAFFVLGDEDIKWWGSAASGAGVEAWFWLRTTHFGATLSRR